MGLLDRIGGAFGKIGDSIFGSRTDNEFRDVNEANFGLPGAQDRSQRLLGLAQGAGGRLAPQAGVSGFRGDQRDLVSLLRAQATGQGPSLAREQAAQAADRGLRGQQALAAGARGGSQAAAARQASQQGSAITGQIAGNSAMARAQEILGARQQLGNVLQGARGQDLQRNLANMQAQLEQTGLNDAQIRALLEQEMRNAALQQQGGIALEGARSGRFNTISQTPTGQEKFIGAAASLAGLPL